MDELNEEKIKQELEKASVAAERLLQDEDKLERILQRAERKLNKIPNIGECVSTIPTFISLVRAFVKKEYTDIPIGSIIAIVGSLIYFLSPVDLLPDVLPGAGYIDDIAVIAIAFKLVKDDVDEYRQWREENGKNR